MSKLEELIKQLCPNGVKYKRLDEVFESFNGMTGVSNKWKENGNCQFIEYMNAYKNLKINIKLLPFATVKKLQQNTLQKGDILLTCASETPDECAVSSVIEDEIKDNVFLDDHLFGIRVKKDMKSEINTTFINYYMHTNNFRKKINKAVRGVTRFYISIDEFMKICIPVPPLEVQCEIVHILDDFTLLSAELSAELKARKRQYEYYKNKIFNNKNVKYMRLEEIGQVKMCKRILKKQTNSISGIPFYKIGTFGKEPDAYISKETYKDYLKKYNHPKKGDILISCAGTIGRTVVYDGKPAYFQDSNIVWLEHDESIVLNKYLLYSYSLNPWNISNGGTIARLYNDNILKAVIPVPTIEDQIKIIKVLDNFDKICNSLMDGLPAEIEARQKQYEYYRDKLLTFKELKVNE